MLQDDVMGGIIRLLREDGIEPGARIVESRLAERLHVSRTPIRSALDQMAEKGYIRRVHNRGVELIELPAPQAAADAPPRSEGDLIMRICHDRNMRVLGDDVTETEVMRRYELSRSEVARLMEQLAALGVMERKLGYGWRFLDSLADAVAREEAYRFRMVVEPAGLLMPGFGLAPGWAEAMRERHNRFRSEKWNPSMSIPFFDMNAAFHLGLAHASGNRYILDAVNRQNHLRRLLNYDWHHGDARVATVCDEHLGILDRIEAGDMEIAALLLRRHIERTIALRPAFDAD